MTKETESAGEICVKQSLVCLCVRDRSVGQIGRERFSGMTGILNIFQKPALQESNAL